MSELWVPGLEAPDATNMYDMMLLFQEQLDDVSDPNDIQSWHPKAIKAVLTLAASLEEMTFEERQVRVAAGLAVVTSVDDPSNRLKVENVGLRGSLSDVHCIKLGRAAKPALALELDVESFFPLQNPDDSDLMLTTATAPIRNIQYIEREIA